MSTEFINDQWRLPNNENKDKQSNYSMKSPGTNSRINISTPANVGVTSSFSFWLKRTNNTVATQPYRISTGSLYYGMYMAGSSAIYVRYGDGYITFNSTATQNALALTDWVHWVITRQEVTSTTQDVKLYANGNLVDSLNGTSSLGTFDSKVDYLMWSLQTTDSMDSFSIFDYALSSSQVTTLYGSSSTGIGNPMSLSPKPVAYYPLGDQDAFNGSNYLVPNSSLKDYVFDFPGNGDNITIDNLFNFSGSDLSISIWYNSNSVVNYDYLLYRVGGSSVLNVYVLNNKLRYEIYAGSERKRIEEGNVVFDGNWHNSIMIFNDTAKTWTVYEDSVFVSTLTATASIDSATTSLYIGSWGGSTGNDYSGLVSNLVIWNSDQSSEKDNIYNNGTPANSYTNTPSGWWKLDASDTYDSSTGNWTIEDHAGSNDGTSSGMTQANLVQSDLSFTSGYSPYALDFDGSNDYIDCGTGLGDSIGDNYAGSLTASLWFKRSSNTLGGLINFTTSGWGEFTVLTYTNFIRFGINATTYPSIQLDYNATNGYTYDTNWHHLAVIMTPNGSVTDIKMYFDGQLLTITPSGTSPTPDQLDFAGKKLYIGTWDGATYSFNGSISNVSIWNTALTSTQVSEIYNEGVPSNLNNHSAYSNLVSWWQLGSNSSFNTNWTVLDEKGSNDGTSANMGEDAIVDGVGSYANAVSVAMSDNIVGDAPYSSSNSLSINMDVLDRTEDTPA